MQWEYAGEELIVATYLADPLERCMEDFNKRGEEGWEMVSTINVFDAERNAQRVFAIFKRAKGEAQP